MNILVLHGPNMNLVGLRSAHTGGRVTLDRINTLLKRKAKELNLSLKIFQTHYAGKAITFLQRNRHWSQGILMSPGPWAKSQYDILDTLKLFRVPVVEVHFSPGFDPDRYSDGSIFQNIAISTVEDHPLEAYASALLELQSYLSKMGTP
ncbi:MAG: type II 3-dehydroquinate dehydratase [Fidelibacterota bacterium]